MVMTQPMVIDITTGSWTEGPLLVVRPIMITVFTAGLAYDPVVISVPAFASVS